ncbi:hypothetical protein ACSLBF_19500 (plasmid) [Pseudoalteromonas sp. T1lg65]|uniref:hypothetical protein n=1 Tax=Pseudoalteromonas sp. T1lg65 TaxID=2077101 RepID=UPI003F78E521
MYTQVDKSKEHKSRAVANSVAQNKSSDKQGFGFVDNRLSAISQRKVGKIFNSYIHDNQTLQLHSLGSVIQKVDMHYWVVKPGEKEYIGSFKSHAEANNWWKANKSDYVGFTFGRGSSDTKYK